MNTDLVNMREWRRVWLFALVVMAFTMVPYLLGWALQTPSQPFSGFLIGVEDGFSYLGKMRLGAAGHWQFYLFYSPEPHPAAPLTFLPYILPGQFLRLFVDADSPALYGGMLATFHTLRIVFGLLLIAVTYRFIAVFIPGPASRFLALVLAILGGGLGVALLPGALPPEFYIPEGFSFLILLTLPHLALARSAMLGGFLILFASEGRRSLAVVSGLLWLVTALAVPFYLAVIYAVLGVWGLLHWLRLRRFPLDLFLRAVIAGGITLPLFGFYLWAFQANLVFAQWSGQNTLPSPPVQHYLLAYGPLLLAAAFSVRSIWQRPEAHFGLLLAWALVGLVMVYLPINVQRRLGEGVIVPLAILAAMGVEGLRLRPQRKTAVRSALVVACLVTTLIFYAGILLTVVARPADLYLSRPTIDAFNWFNAHAIERERGAVVLAPYTVGNRLPAFTNLRPFIGHGPESVNGEQKRALLAAYLSGDMSAEEAQTLYETYTIDYVYVEGEAPIPQDGLREVYAADDVTIYEVTP